MSYVSSAVRPGLKEHSALPIASSLKFPNPSVFPTKLMYCDVVFGSPSMDCNGTGICKITGTNAVKHLHLKKECRLTLGQIASANNGKVSLFFFREFLCIKLYRQHFHKGVLHMQEACPIPAEISRELNISGKRLLPGNYTVHVCDGYYRVDIDFV